MVLGYEQRNLFILRNQKLFWATEASWVEVTRSINFVPVLVSQQSHINGEKAIFLVCEVAVVNSFTLTLTKKERGEKLETHLAYRKNLITMLTGNETKTGRPSSSTDKIGWMEKFISSYRRKTSQQKNAWFSALGK
jgi:hypothetical protein